MHEHKKNRKSIKIYFTNTILSLAKQYDAIFKKNATLSDKKEKIYINERFDRQF